MSHPNTVVGDKIPYLSLWRNVTVAFMPRPWARQILRVKGTYVQKKTKPKMTGTNSTYVTFFFYLTVYTKRSQITRTLLPKWIHTKYLNKQFGKETINNCLLLDLDCVLRHHVPVVHIRTENLFSSPFCFSSFKG